MSKTFNRCNKANRRMTMANQFLKTFMAAMATIFLIHSVCAASLGVNVKNLLHPDEASQSSFANTPLPVDVRFAEHDGYFVDHHHDPFYDSAEEILTQARVLVAVIDEDDILKRWQGAVSYVVDYKTPSVGDNMIEYWQSFEEILYVYQKFRNECANIGESKECVTEKVLSAGQSYYQFHFRGISHGLCIMRVIEMPTFGAQQEAVAEEKRELEQKKNAMVTSFSENHFTPLMLMDTSVEEIRKESHLLRTALAVHEESIMQFLHSVIESTTPFALQEAYKAKTAFEEVMKRIDRFSKKFEHHTAAVITQTSDLRQKTLNMLEYSEICSGTFKLHRGDRLNLIEMCREAHGLFGAKAANLKSVGFLTRISAGRYNPYITIDSQRFRQALFAVLQNSVQFSHTNGDPIEFTLLMEGDTIRFICRDFGCGISDDNLKKICDPFYSHDPMGKHQQSLGLGLFLTKRIIESMGGSLNIVSDDGTSTTVELQLPMSCITHHQIEMESIPERASIPSVNQVYRRPSMMTYNAYSEPDVFYDTVLISEDSDIAARVLTKFVEKSGYKYELYKTGEAALRAFQDEPQKYFLALLDFFTPPSQVRGSEIAQALLQRNPRLAIVIISANEDAVVKDAVAAIEGVRFMRKPFHHHKEQLVQLMGDAYNVAQNK